jgi:outer membrane autotransporter protein
MKKYVNGLLILVLLAVGASVHAQTQKPANPWYGELAYAPVKIKQVDATDGTAKNLRGIVGYELNPNVALEGLLSLGVGDASATVSGDPVDTRVNRVVGLYVKPKVAVSQDIEFFARLGYARTKVTSTLTATGEAESESASDVSYGLGASYRINDRWSAVVDYMRYPDKNGVRLQGLSAGLRVKF